MLNYFPRTLKWGTWIRRNRNGDEFIPGTWNGFQGMGWAQGVSPCPLVIPSSTRQIAIARDNPSKMGVQLPIKKQTLKLESMITQT